MLVTCGLVLRVCTGLIPSPHPPIVVRECQSNWVLKEFKPSYFSVQTRVN